MKKKSIKDLDKLKQKGWQINGDSQKIAQYKQLSGIQKSLKDATEENKQVSKSLGNSFDKFSKTIVDSGNKQTDQFMKMMNLHMVTIKEILKKEPPEPKPKNWELDVKRNNKGFISKIFAKQV